MSSVRRIATMAAFTTWRAFKTPGGIAWKILFPVVFGAVIAFLAGGESIQAPAVVMVDEDGTPEARALIEAMAATPFDVSLASREQAEDGIVEGKLKSALVIPAGFADSLKAGTASLEVVHGEGYVRGEAEARAALVARAMALGMPAPGPAVVHELPRGSEAYGEYGKVHGVFGIYLILSLSALISSACTLHEEREEGRLQRTLAAGVPFGEVVIALVAGVALIGVVQAAGVLGITGWWGTPWLASGWSAIAVTTLGVVVAFSGIGVGIAGFIPGPNQAKVISVGVPLLLAYVGGVFWPLELEPGVLQEFARINPMYWAMEALRGGFVFEGLSSQLVPLAVLILTGVLGMVLGVQGLRRIAR